jgi:hypothetical protein
MTVIHLHNTAPIPKDELDRQAVGTAIVILHGDGRYWEAMDILCRVVGWPPLVRGFSTQEERDEWLAKIKPMLASAPTPSPAPSPGRIKCASCKRYYDPNKVIKRHYLNTCSLCGRHFNQNGKGKAR